MSYSPNEDTPLAKDVVDWAKETGPLLFEAIRSPRQVSALLAISPFVARYLCSYISESTRGILEIGPGAGALTGLARTILHPEGRFIVIDKNPRMVKHLKGRFKKSDVVIHEGDAVQLDTMVDDQVDIVFSSIPISMIPEAIAMQIIGKIQSVLKEGGLFICFQNTTVADGYIRRVFEDVTYKLHKKHFPKQHITIARKSGQH